MFDPYHKWLGIPKDQRPPTYYQLLGIAPGETDQEVIDEAAVRQIAHVRTYQIGPHAAEATRLLNEISQAKTTLLNPAKRKAYDEKLATVPAAQITTAKPPPAAVPAAMAPSAPSAFSFDNDEEEPPPPVSRRNLNIARATNGNAGLWIAAIAGGGIVALASVVVAIVLAMRSQPVMQMPAAVVKKEDKNGPKQNAKAADKLDPNRDNGPGKNNPAPQIDPPVNPPRVNPPKGADKTPMARFQTQENHIRWLSLSPDGSKVAIGNVFPRVYDLATGKEVSKFLPRQNGGVLMTPVAFLPDNKRVMFAFGGESGAAGIGDAMTGQALFYLSKPPDVQYASSLAVTPDGKRALVGHNHRLGYWDLDKRQEIKSWPIKGIVSEINFLPDGKSAITGDEDGFVTVWDLDTFNTIFRHHHSSAVKSLAVSSDGVVCAVGCSSTIVLFNLQKKQAETFISNKLFSGAVSFAQDGKLLIGGDDGRITVWDPDQKKSVGTWNGHGASVTRIAADAKENIAVSGDASGTVLVWSLKTAPAAVAKRPEPAGHGQPVAAGAPASHIFRTADHTFPDNQRVLFAHDSDSAMAVGDADDFPARAFRAYIFPATMPTSQMRTSSLPVARI